MTTHYLKTWPEPFNASLGGLKPFEVRVDDRGFAAGDTLCLQEWDPYGKAYTGRELMRRVTCVIRSAGPLALPDGLVVLGVEDAALAALDALTRELEEAKKDSTTLNSLGHALGRCYCTDQGCYTVEPEILMERARELMAIERSEWDWQETQATIADQAERIAKLEDALTIAKIAMAERRSYINGGDPSGCWQEMKYGTIWDEEDAQVAAALAPKEQ